MVITSLVENTSCRPDVGQEHGLSLFIQSGGHTILFDFGQSELFCENAFALGADLTSVEYGVLSHGHYDHGGGLRRFLQVNSNANVYVSRAALEKHYNAKNKYIGLDEELCGNSRLLPVDSELQLAPQIRIMNCQSQRLITPIEPFGLTVMKENALIPEDFRHEQYLEITEGGKKVLFSGCSHRGILNIVEWTKPDVLVGGFHFMKVSLDREGKKKLRMIAEQLMSYNTIYYTCHCTGIPQYTYLKEIMGDRLHYVSAGTVIRGFHEYVE